MNTPDLLVAGLPLIAIVIGLVQFVKVELEWQGKGVKIFAIALGLAAGFGYHVYAAPAPIAWDFNFIFEALIYGLAVGLAATGIYDAFKPKTPTPMG